MTVQMKAIRINPIKVSYPHQTRVAIEDTVFYWKQFTSLRHCHKSAFSFVEEKMKSGVSLSDAGYECKGGIGRKTDSKENFHVTMSQYKRLIHTASSIKQEFADYITTLNFLESSKQLINKIEPIVIDFASLSGTSLCEEVTNAKPYWILRYLHYFDRNSQEANELAAPHIDKHGFTLHLYEDYEGLEVLTSNSEWGKVDPLHTKNNTIILPGAQLQLRTQGDYKAVCHRVVSTNNCQAIDQPLHLYNKGRYSVVCFIPFIRTPMYNKVKYGSMQGHSPGFNYNMSHADFSKFFQN